MSRIFAVAMVVCLYLALTGGATAQTQSTCQTWLATDPNPSGIPGVSGLGVSQRTNLLAAGGKLVAIAGRYYSASIPAAFYTAELPVVIFDLHGTNGYPEAEWNDWYGSMSARGFALIALSWGGGTPGAATDVQLNTQLKQILAEVSANCPIAGARKYVLGFSVGSAMSFAVMIRDVADQKMFRGQLAISGAAASPLITGRDVMHATVEANRSNPTAVQGIKSWMYCGVMDHDHYYPDPSSWWSMCDEMPNGEAFVNEHGGTATLYQDPTGTHQSLSSSTAGYNLMYDFMVAQDAQTITFGTVPSLTVGGTVTASATATSGLTVIFTATTPSVCTVSGTTVAGITVGTCTITASQSGNSSYAAAAQVTQSFSVSKANQTIGTISFSPSTLAVGGTTTASATATSGLAVAFSSTTPTICSAFGSTVTGIASGTCTVAADQTGNATYAAAIQVRQNINIAALSTRLVNISTRGSVQTGDNVMIGGFVIGGSTPKKVLIRAVGPNLANYGVTGVLADPTLQLFSGSTAIATNTDWQSAANAADIQATGLAPANAKESAILTTLNPGAYTAIVSGMAAGTGVGIVEVYELDNPASQFTNISTRGQVLTGDNVMIGGFVIQGDTAKTLLIRAVGPNLANYGVTGVLANPTVTLYSGSTMIASNDDWGTATNAAAIQATGLAPVSPLESAILTTLPPGAYTAVVSGSGGGTGVGIVEVYAQ